jgi:AraC family transcriptional activator of pobA
MQFSTNIPVNKQKVTAVGGLDIIHLTSKAQQPKMLNDHRDEYYIVAIVIKGAGLLKCDMGSIQILPMSIVLIKPYQVHSGKLTDDNSEGYFISIAPFLIPAFCRNVFDDLVVSEQAKQLLMSDFEVLLKTVELVYQAFNTYNIYKVQITINLLNALLVYVCSFFSLAKPKPEQKRSQSLILTQHFKKLVLQHSSQHTPSFFAEKLHITTSHLNDCVKTTIGMSVTQFLQQTMLLEAKRQLFYTNDDVKKIAFNLGFEDHTYFSRLFKKLTNETPLAFRSKFRE